LAGFEPSRISTALNLSRSQVDHLLRRGIQQLRAMMRTE